MNNLNEYSNIQPIKNEEIKETHIKDQPAIKTSKIKRESEGKIASKSSSSRSSSSSSSSKRESRSVVGRLSSLSGLDAMLTATSSGSLKTKSSKKTPLASSLEKLEKIMSLDLENKNSLAIIKEAQWVVRSSGQIPYYELKMPRDIHEFDHVLGVVQQIPYNSDTSFNILHGFVYTAVRRMAENLFTLDLEKMETKTTPSKKVSIQTDDKTFKNILETRLSEFHNPDLKLCYLKCFKDSPMSLSKAKEDIIFKIQNDIINNLDLKSISNQTKEKTIESGIDLQLKKMKEYGLNDVSLYLKKLHNIK